MDFQAESANPKILPSMEQPWDFLQLSAFPQHTTILTDDLSWDPATVVTDLLDVTTVDKHTRLNQRKANYFWDDLRE